MIVLSDRPKKRFRIELKVNLHSKNKSKFDYNLQLAHNNLAKLKAEIDDLEFQYNELQTLSDNNLEIQNQIKSIQSKLEIKKSQLTELNKFNDRSTISTQNIKYIAKTIRLGFFYKFDKLWTKTLWVVLIGSLVSILTWLLVQYTGVYTPGVSGIIQGIAKITRIQIINSGNILLAETVYNILFWALYVVINIPLLIFAYYKISKNFAILSTVFILTSRLIGFGLGFINIQNGIFIFTNMYPESLEQVPGFIENVQILPWNSNEGLVFGLFMYSLVYSSLCGVAYSIIYILGSSTGGTDIIGFYYSKIKNKSIGNLLTIFNIISLFFGVILGSFICWILQAPKYNIDLHDTNLITSMFFSPNLIASVFGALLSGIIFNYFFPRNKVIKVQIYSDKINEIAIALKSSEWNYKISLNNDLNQSSYENDSQLFSSSKTLETVCFYIDMPMLLSIMKSIDSQGLITIYSTFGFAGELPSSTYEL